MTGFLRRSHAAKCVALLFAGSLALACGAPSDVTEVSQSELSAALANGSAPLVLDARTPEEFAAGHVPGAVNIPHDTLEQRLGEIDVRRDREIVVYCERGPRAARAEAVLTKAGFTAVRHLAGDMAAWRQARLPVAK